MLKQPNGTPLSVALQVASIYAVNNGFVDHVHVTDVVTWEKGLHEFLTVSHKDFLATLNKDWSDEVELPFEVS
jgi:F-type H+-transporting ATPase subunit alpha